MRLASARRSRRARPAALRFHACPPSAKSYSKPTLRVAGFEVTRDTPALKAAFASVVSDVRQMENIAAARPKTAAAFIQALPETTKSADGGESGGAR